MCELMCGRHVCVCMCVCVCEWVCGRHGVCVTGIVWCVCGKRDVCMHESI